ncbi:ModE family transcriptional regulator [Hyphomicrobium nitrativorans NL23]|uniref:ModE family transcriptional regulator n=1 Tax=Hyphomicrobium nitrativorans NL23 TaxID=1029756 RepID=V5SCZ1_9HYPH|nr:LysR family transcriptional regulator [Hyphomicrobium nitrativorans]AHB48342.1 ModE family transcriptional regulator [Hyphomicrobium nitrativorans NL23]
MAGQKKMKADVPRRKLIADKGPLSRATLRLRIVFSAERKIGPGKVDLLETIARTGSISSAARELGMSYRRAWLLMDEFGRLFKRPILTTAAGGAHGGGAELTDFGRAVIAAYRRIEDRTAEVVRSELVAFESDINNDP